MGSRPPSSEELAQRREAELQALYLITQAANFSVTVDDILELIYTQIQRVLDTPTFYIALADAERKSLSYAFYVEGNERLYPQEQWPITTGLSGAILSKGTPIRTDNYQEECKSRDIPPKDPSIQCWMGVPLAVQDQAIGVMVASSCDREITFSEADQGLFVTIASYTAATIERRRLYERLETRALQLHTLNEIGKLLASSLDIDEVLDLVVHNATTLLDTEGGSLLLLDDVSGDLVFRVSSGPAGEKLSGLKVPAGKGIAGVCFSENKPIIVNDAQHDQRWYRSFDRTAEFITHSLLAVPLNARGRTIGLIEVINRKNGGIFDQEDVDLLLSFGAQAAIAIENARLFTTTDRALQNRVEELSTIQHIDRQLNATLDYREVINLTLSWAIRLTNATTGIIAALDEGQEGPPGLHILAHEGYPPEIFEPYEERELWPLDKGLIGQTVRSGQITLIDDVSKVSDYVECQPDIQAHLSVPMQRENKVIGVIAIESQEAGCFTQEAVDFITRLAEHAAIAIDNARLFQQVQRANQAKTEFVSFVSHELKQPMTSIKGYTDLLMKGIAGELNEQQRAFLNVILASVRHMDRLVSDLLDISRIESGRLKLEMNSFHPVSITNEAIEAFSQTMREKQQVFEIDIMPELPNIYADRGRLLQVLTNLLSNASKYTPESGHITLKVNHQQLDGEAYVYWSVKDDGIGMTPDELGKLFTKYFRSQNPAVRSVKGTGLGLAITRSIVELHGGHMYVESEAGKGSTFSFIIPAEKVPHEPDAEAAEQPQVPIDKLENP